MATPDLHYDYITIDQYDFKGDDVLAQLIEKLKDLHNQGYKINDGEITLCRSTPSTLELKIEEIRKEAGSIQKLIQDRESSRDFYELKAEELRTTYQRKIAELRQLESELNHGK